MKFNEKITLLRKQRGMTQEQLSFQIGVSRQSISKWELGESEPDIRRLVDIATFFNVSTDYLLFDNYEEKVDKMEEHINHVTNNNYKIVKMTPLWLIFTSGIFGIGACIIVTYIFPHHYCYTGHSGLLSYFEDWCFESILWKLFFIAFLAMLIIGGFRALRVKKS